MAFWKDIHFYRSQAGECADHNEPWASEGNGQKSTDNMQNGAGVLGQRDLQLQKKYHEGWLLQSKFRAYWADFQATQALTKSQKIRQKKKQKQRREVLEQQLREIEGIQVSLGSSTTDKSSGTTGDGASKKIATIDFSFVINFSILKNKL